CAGDQSAKSAAALRHKESRTRVARDCSCRKGDGARRVQRSDVLDVAIQVEGRSEIDGQSLSVREDGICPPVQYQRALEDVGGAVVILRRGKGQRPAQRLGKATRGNDRSGN